MEQVERFARTPEEWNAMTGALIRKGDAIVRLHGMYQDIPYPGDYVEVGLDRVTYQPVTDKPTSEGVSRDAGRYAHDADGPMWFPEDAAVGDALLQLSYAIEDDKKAMTYESWALLKSRIIEIRKAILAFALPEPKE